MVWENAFIKILENLWYKFMQLKNLCYYTFKIYNSDHKIWISNVQSKVFRLATGHFCKILQNCVINSCNIQRGFARAAWYNCSTLSCERWTNEPLGKNFARYCAWYSNELDIVKFWTKLIWLEKLLFWPTLSSKLVLLLLHSS